jgi:hypothetical protein
MSDAKQVPSNPLSKLDPQELLWMVGILKDACRERLEKNLVNQAFEERLRQRGPVEGRVDPRPFLEIWEPRYRKLLDVASELYAVLEGQEVKAAARSLQNKIEAADDYRRQPPVSTRSLQPVDATPRPRRARAR